MVRPVAGMRVLVTGASSGIGAALAAALVAEGARVLLAARRADRLESLATGLGPRARWIAADVARPADCARAVAAAVEAWGGLDTLVCNAGYGLLRPVIDTTPEEWAAILATNLAGTAECVRAAVPVMLAQPVAHGWRGQVVVVSSILARRGTPGGGAYCATKAAQLSLVEALRVELATSRIAVTSVHPVGTDTGFAAAAEQVGGRPWATDAREPRQSAATVARAILAGIRRPRPEVWPLGWSRLAAAAAVLLPGLADWQLRRRWRRQAGGAPSLACAPGPLPSPPHAP